MLLTYTCSEEDFVRAGALKLRKSSRLFSPWVGGIWMALLLSYIVLFPGARASLHDSVDWKTILAFSLPVFLMILPFSLRKTLRKQYRNSPIMRETRTLQADFSGVHFRCASFSSDVTWSVYGAFAEDKYSFLLLQQGSAIFVPIPKRELSEEQITGLRLLFENHLLRR